MAGVMIVGEASEGRLSRATLQAASAGRQVAEKLGEPLLGALIGANVDAVAGEFQCGLAVLYLVSGEHYQPYTAEAYVCAAQAIVEAASPSVVLFAHGADTRDWVPQLAARIGAGLVMDCTGVAVEGDALVVTKTVNGGGVSAEFAIGGKPRLATLRASAFQPATGEGAAERLCVEVAPPQSARVVVLTEQSAVASAGPRLKDAKIVVSGGRGIGGPENWHYIEEASAALGAAVGCSRPVADSGWVPSSHQVGLSGTIVAPDLYIAVGISGAAQHLAGISAARTVVAINNSADADIFSRADFGIVEDYREVLPAFVERVRQLRG
ncbi:MAG: electron transfer flavoprotein subunit alpha/FixB family protein [Burkholderiales bacterium]